MKYLTCIGLLASLVVMVKPQGQDYGPNRSGGSAMSMFSGPRLAPGGLAPKTSQKIPQGLNINPGDYSPPSSGSSSSSASSKPALDFSQLRGISGIGGMPNIAALQNQLNARPAASAASNPFMGLFGGLLAMGGGDAFGEMTPCLFMRSPACLLVM